MWAMIEKLRMRDCGMEPARSAVTPTIITRRTADGRALIDPTLVGIYSMRPNPFAVSTASDLVLAPSF